MKLDSDSRIVMTLDAGGTNFRFAAMRGGKPITETVALPSNGDDLERCLAGMVDGFKRVKALCPEPPWRSASPSPARRTTRAASSATSGTCPAFRGGVALGPMLEEKFGVPVFINNDGDLFVYGEAIGGFLPFINEQLEQAGSPKRYKNLFGVTLGTGFGGGIVRDGQLFIGDNSMAGEVWLLRNKLQPEMNAEEGACIRAVRRVYAEQSGTPFDQTPEPKVLCDIANGTAPGNQGAAVEAFRRLGESAGDAMGSRVDPAGQPGGDRRRGIRRMAVVLARPGGGTQRDLYRATRQHLPTPRFGRLQPGGRGATADLPQGGRPRGPSARQHAPREL